MVQSERYLIFADKYIFIGKYKGKKNVKGLKEYKKIIIP